MCLCNLLWSKHGSVESLSMHTYMHAYIQTALHLYLYACASCLPVTQLGLPPTRFLSLSCLTRVKARWVRVATLWRSSLPSPPLCMRRDWHTMWLANGCCLRFSDSYNRQDYRSTGLSAMHLVRNLLFCFLTSPLCRRSARPTGPVTSVRLWKQIQVGIALRCGRVRR